MHRPVPIGVVFQTLRAAAAQARRLPKDKLVRTVRAVFEANEYPASMRRLYLWSPDECIPEFYTDASIFSSCHPDMPDLAVPDWAEGPADFIRQHRCMLVPCTETQHLLFSILPCVCNPEFRDGEERRCAPLVLLQGSKFYQSQRQRFSNPANQPSALPTVYTCPNMLVLLKPKSCLL